MVPRGVGAAPTGCSPSASAVQEVGTRTGVHTSHTHTPLTRVTSPLRGLGDLWGLPEWGVPRTGSEWFRYPRSSLVAVWCSRPAHVARAWVPRVSVFTRCPGQGRPALPRVAHYEITGYRQTGFSDAPRSEGALAPPQKSPDLVGRRC